MVGTYGNTVSGWWHTIGRPSRSLVATTSLWLACGFGACSNDPESAAQTDVIADAGGTDTVAADTAGDTFFPVDVDVSQFCQGPVSYRYDPLSGQQFTTFPDDLWTRPDSTSPTGLRVFFDPLLAPWVQASPPILKNAVQDLQTLDGWGVLAGVTLQFSGPVAALAEYATPSDSDDLQLVDLSVQPPQQVPFEVQRTDDDKTLILWPLVPLKSRIHYAAFLRRGKNQSQTACVRPSDVLIQLLAGKGGENAVLQQLAPRYQAALQALQLPPG